MKRRKLAGAPSHHETDRFPVVDQCCSSSRLDRFDETRPRVAAGSASRETGPAGNLESAKMTELPPNNSPVGKISEKRSTAQQRWRILAEALIRPRRPISIDGKDEVSVRRFTSFDLLRIDRVENATTEPDSAAWYVYSTILENKLYSVQVRRVNKNFTVSELIGFNNTGNICVWPSEECLTYYLLKNRQLCRNRRILELGGGMSCLAGMFVAKYCDPREVTLTDGNVTSVNNVRRIVGRNGMTDFVECGVVQWAKAVRAIRAIRAIRTIRAIRAPRSIKPLLLHPRNNGLRVKSEKPSDVKEGARIADKLYDVILCADCLFFDEARPDLVETIYGWLANDGVALVMAPSRGSTFEKFADAAIKRGFAARQIDRYDGKIWSRHLELLEQNQEYRPDLHYPILLELTKQKKTAPG